MKADRAKRRKGIHKFVTTSDITFYQTTIQKEFENEWLKINLNGDLTVKGSYGNGYAWDGCSPKINIFDHFSRFSVIFTKKDKKTEKS